MEKGQGTEEADADAKTNEQKRPENRNRRGKPYRMIGVLSVFFLGVLFFVALAFAFHYGQAGKSTHALWWGVASAICAIMGIGLYVQQNIISVKPPERDRVEMLEKTIQKSNRAVVVLRAAYMLSSVRKNPDSNAVLEFTNTGLTSAQNVRLRVNRKFLTHEEFDQAKKGIMPEARDEPFQSGVTIGQGITVKHETVPGVWEDSSKRDAAIRGELTFCVWGAVWYDDSYGGSWISHFSMYNESPDTIAFRAFASGNYVEEGKPPAVAAIPRPNIQFQGAMGKVTSSEINCAFFVRNEGDAEASIDLSYGVVWDTQLSAKHIVSDCPAGTVTRESHVIAPNGGEIPISLRIFDRIQDVRAGRLYLFVVAKVDHLDLGRLRSKHLCFVYNDSIKSVIDCSAPQSDRDTQQNPN